MSTTIEKEWLTKKWMVESFHCYILERKFTVVTDHTQHTFKMASPNEGRQAIINPMILKPVTL